MTEELTLAAKMRNFLVAALPQPAETQGILDALEEMRQVFVGQIGGVCDIRDEDVLKNEPLLGEPMSEFGAGTYCLILAMVDWSVLLMVYTNGQVAILDSHLDELAFSTIEYVASDERASTGGNHGLDNLTKAE